MHNDPYAKTKLFKQNPEIVERPLAELEKCRGSDRRRPAVEDDMIPVLRG